MRRVLIMTIAIWWSTSTIVSIDAQDIFIVPHSPATLLLQQYDISPIYIPRLETKFIKLIRIERNLDGISLGSLGFSKVSVKPLKQESHNELLDSYVRILRSERTKARILQSGVHAASRKYIKAFLNPPKVDEEKKIRQLWKEFFGIDVWYPYYKAKEIEDWVKERMSVKIWKFKGKPRFRKDRFDYTFKMRF